MTDAAAALRSRWGTLTSVQHCKRSSGSAQTQHDAFLMGSDGETVTIAAVA